MERKLGILLMFLFVLTSGFGTVSAQFEIKIPKIKKPKIEQPKSDEPKPEQPNPNGGNSAPEPRDAGADQNSGKKSKDAVGYMPKPQPSSVPVLLKDTLEIKVYRGTKYWKYPNERDYSSWMPLVSFNIFHDKSETVRYTAEWLNADGSLWFSEAIDGTQTRYSGEIFDTKASASAGTFGLRLLNTKTKEVVFQGKFNVKKILLFPNDPRQKNNATFYVDQDWSLPVGYVGFNDSTSWDKDPTPTVYLWFKGDLKREDFEARLFHNNHQIASTDDGGPVYDGDATRNSDSCFEQTEICRYRLWQFSWNLKVESLDKVEHRLSDGYYRDPKAIYTIDKPGEYTVKVFHKGVQVREAKFAVQPNGWLAPNPFAKQLPMRNYKAVIPVKIMGSLDKWNAAAWKTEAFYANPLTNFGVQ